MSTDTTHIVAIVGRPNVGKSTLFNRLVGRKKAIITPEAGGTRDRNYDISEWGRHTFTVIDTGGYMPGEGPNFEKAIRTQVKVAIDECQLILFVVDCKEGITPNDHTIAALLRKSGKTVLIVANKADNYNLLMEAPTFHALGSMPVYPISATHGSGTGDLMDAIVDDLKQQDTSIADASAQEEFPRISFIGRPNVGKSTLMNALLGKDRSIVSERAHTTRDSVNSLYNLYNKKILLTDTAGIYRKKSDKDAIEFYSLIRSVKAIQHSDVCVVVISAEEGLTKQDHHIMQLAHSRKKGMVLLVNKWDVIDKEIYSAERYRKELATHLGTLAYVPVLFTSGLHKQRIFQIMEKALQVYENRKSRISTPKLNDFLQAAVNKTPPPMLKGKLIKIKYATQMPLPSPTFALFANLPQYVQTPYKRYLTNQLRENFDLEGTPVTLVFKKK